METKRIPLPSILATRDPSLTKDGLLTNCYYEHGPDAERIVKRPGTILAANLGGDCPGQGAFFFAGGPVFIVCDTLHVGLPPSTCVVVPPPTPRVTYLGVIDTVFNAPMSTLSPATKWIWTVVNQIAYQSTLRLTVVSDVGEQVIANFTESSIIGVVGSNTMSIADVASIDEVWVLLKAFPTQSRAAQVARFSAGVAAMDGTASTPPAFIGITEIIDSPIDPQFMGYDPVTNKVWIEFAQSNANIATIAIVDPVTKTVEYSQSLGTAIGFGVQFVFGYPYVMLVTAQGSNVDPAILVFDANTYALLYTIANSAISTALVGKVADYDSARQRFIVLPQSGLQYTMIAAATGAMSFSTLTLAPNPDTVPAPSTASLINAITYFAQLDKYMFGQNTNGSEGSTLYIVNAETLESQFTYTYETGSDKLIQNFYEQPGFDDYVLSFDLTHVKRLNFGTPC